MQLLTSLTLLPLTILGAQYNIKQHAKTCGRPKISIDEQKLFSPEQYRGLIEHGQSGDPDDTVVFQSNMAQFRTTRSNVTLPDKRIVGGTISTPGSWPWHVRVKLCANRGSRPTFCIMLCGGTLISNRYALTAAHCQPSGVFSDESRIYVGEYLYDKTYNYDKGGNDIYGYRYYADKVIRHPGWSRATRRNDIAIVKTVELVSMTEYVQPLCLPKQEEVCYQPDTKCVVVGWGYLNERGPVSRKLMEVAVKMLDHDTCNKQSWYAGYVKESMMCAGFPEGGRDSCSGDSGGALFCKASPNNPWVQYGIVSWGYGCAREKRPGVYTNVAMYGAWIEEATRLDGLTSITNQDTKNPFAGCLSCDAARNQNPECAALHMPVDGSWKPPVTQNTTPFTTTTKAPKSTTTTSKPTKPTTTKKPKTTTTTTTVATTTKPENESTCRCNCDFKFTKDDDLKELVVKTPGYDSIGLTPMTCVYDFKPQRTHENSKIALKTECSVPTNRRCQKTGTYLQTYREVAGKARRRRHYSCDNSGQLFTANQFKSTLFSKVTSKKKRGCKLTATYYHDYVDSGCGDGHRAVKVPKCGSRVIKLQNGYKNNLDCLWEVQAAYEVNQLDITLGWNKKIHGCITRLPTRNKDGECDQDYLEVQTGPNEKVKMCGAMKNLKSTFGKSRSLTGKGMRKLAYNPTIKFHSDNTFTGRRFEKGFCFIISDASAECRA